MPVALPQLLLHRDIEKRIPHKGSMCLLERVITWDASQIHCEAINHGAINNPLRAYGRLGASCGVEYAAQAMAVHGALIAEAELAPGQQLAPQVGYLASVRGVSLHTDRLDHVEGALTIYAERTSGDASTIWYTFLVRAGALDLLSGRAVVVLNAADLLTKPSSSAV